jgi:hypothetical protein
MTRSPGNVFGDALRWVELAERLREAEASVLRALGLLRGVDSEISATASVTLSQAEVAAALAECDEAVEAVADVAEIASAMRAEGVEIKRIDLGVQAGAALAAGVGDIRRVRVLARCLPSRDGFGALAEVLRCTDSHEVWGDTTVGDLLGWFRDVDDPLVRKLTERALLSPETAWAELARPQVSRLAAALEAHATAVRSQ